MESEDNWSVTVENLVDGEDVEGAISLLESVISKLETLNSSPSDLQLASALTDLANIYSSRGFSLKSDELQTRAFLIKQRALQIPHSLGDSVTVKKEDSEENEVLASGGSVCAASACASASSDDDWEAIADLPSNEVFSPQHDAGISTLSLEDTELQTPKRRGRGAFLYRENSLYSDQQSDVTPSGYSDDEGVHHSSVENTEIKDCRFGTSHVIVLADFPPSTTTIELEKLFENFKDSGVAIRWVNDTVALAVFRTPSLALEARNSIHVPFTVRVISEDDMSSISVRDLEPPYPRPMTSVRTAQRLIARGMGQKLSTTTFGSSELRKQEEARRNRIVTRQLLRDEAWGTDET